MKRPFPRVVLLAALAAAAAPSVLSTPPRVGDVVWSKHVDTALLAEPRPLAPPVASIGFAQKLAVVGAEGAWLKVEAAEASGDTGSGWVFQGNVAREKPSMAPASGWTTLDASDTDTVAAARPLTPAAADYAARHGATDAEADIAWLDAQAAAVSAGEAVAYMQANGKGEYQP